MLNRICGASRERVATLYPASATATASVGAARVRGDRDERPGYLGAGNLGKVFQCKVFEARVAKSGRSTATSTS